MPQFQAPRYKSLALKRGDLKTFAADKINSFLNVTPIRNQEMQINKSLDLKNKDMIE